MAKRDKVMKLPIKPQPEPQITDIDPPKPEPKVIRVGIRFDHLPIGVRTRMLCGWSLAFTVEVVPETMNSRLTDAIAVPPTWWPWKSNG